MFPMTIDGARAEVSYRRDVLTRSYGSRPRAARRTRLARRLPAMLRAQLHLRLAHR